MADGRMYSQDPYIKFCKELVPTNKPRLSLAARTGEDEMVTELKPEFEQNIKDFYQTHQPERVSHHFQNLSDILSGSFIVGESHDESAPKKFLIDNMKTFKDAGYKTLYMEHLYYDDQQLLDNYFNTGRMSQELQDHLEKLNRGHGVAHTKDMDQHYMNWNIYNFRTLIEAAREAGIRVVGIDVRAVYETQKMSKHIPMKDPRESKKRFQYMNYTAYQIIQREEARKPEQDRKWLALMGNAHVNTMQSVPGVADLLNVPSVYVFDEHKELNFLDKLRNKETQKAKSEPPVLPPVLVEYGAERNISTVRLSGDVMITITLAAKAPLLEFNPLDKEEKRDLR